MKSVNLKATARTLIGGTGSKKIRQGGGIPAVLYGRDIQPQPLEINAKELDEVMHHHVSESLLVDLQVDGKSHLALVQEVQHHPLKRGVIHVDFHEVSEKEPVSVSVPVETTGESVGVKAGGVLEHVRHSIRIRALPRDLPEVVLVDVSNLEVGRAIHVSDVQVPEGVEFEEEPDLVLISCAAPRVEVEEAPTEEVAPMAAAGADDVEMIKERKESDDEKAESKG